jgi:predicted transposase YbfD/YdcC
MLKEEISLDENLNKVTVNLTLDDKDVYDILYGKNYSEKIDIIKRSIKIGVMALKNASITIDTNYVRKEIDRLIIDFDQNLKTNLGKDGFIGNLEKIFGENGLLENNLKEKFKEHDKVIADIFKEDNINSPFYRIKRFIQENAKQTDTNLYDLLDPDNNNSLLFRLKEDIIKKIDDVKISGNIESLNKSIESIKTYNRNENEIIKRDIQGVKEDYTNKFMDVQRSLREQIGDVRDIATNTNIELAKLVKEKQIIDITTLKGMKFDDVLFDFLSTRALYKYGDTVEVVNIGGGDRTGDFIINIKNNSHKIVVKAESTSKENVQMPNTILRQLNGAMKSRNTDYGIKVYENELPEKIGPILIADNMIICSYLRGYTFEGYPLEVAYEILRSMILRKELGIDRQNVKLHIDNIVRSLGALQYITGNLTRMENLCTNTKSQVEELRKNINVELDQIMCFYNNKE